MKRGASRSPRISDVSYARWSRGGRVSRILSKTRASSDDHFSGPPVSRRLKRPTRKSWRIGPIRADRTGEISSLDRTAPLLGLAPGGVCRARPVTRPAGELLPRRFTLTPPARNRTGVAVSFLWHFPYPDPIQAVGVTHHRALRSPDFPPWLAMVPMSP